MEKIRPLQILNHPEKILVIIPKNTFDKIFGSLKRLKNLFSNSQFIAFCEEGDLSKDVYNLFDKVIVYRGKLRTLSSQFFKLKKEIKNIKPTVSIDFNEDTDIFSAMVSAKMKMGFLNSPHINMRIDVENDLPIEEKAERFVKIINSMVCTGD